MVLALIAVGVGFFPYALVTPRGAQAAVRAWARYAVWSLGVIVGIRVEIRGREHIPAGAALVAAKHQAILDTLLPAVMLDRPAIVLREGLTKIPIFGWYCRRAGMIVLDREGHASALRNMLRAARVPAAENRPIVIFPEGTRRPPGAPPDYKPGVAALYRDLKIPCTPVAQNIGLFWPTRGVNLKPGLAVMEFLPAIPAGLSRDEFMTELETRIETASNALLAEAAAKP
jgi:1-acyl-sn-glycerol-3-phosphate acyltransferase